MHCPVLRNYAMLNKTVKSITDFILTALITKTLCAPKHYVLAYGTRGQHLLSVFPSL